MSAALKISTLMKRRRALAAPLLIALLAGVVLLIVTQISSPGRLDPLYTDLRAWPLYAKAGFQPDYAKITDPASQHWDLTLAPHSGRVIMSDLNIPAPSPRYGPFSIADRKIEEFTILMPFTLRQEAAQRLQGSDPVHPVLHLASIGENWEIFLNGKQIARQIDLDANGRIAGFRNIRDLSIPVGETTLRAGDNVLVIHILGAYSSKWTGLRYSSPYYLGSSSYTFSDYRGALNFVMCAIFLFTGLFHLLIYAFRKTDRYSLLFTAFTLTASLYYLAETQIINVLVPNTAFGQRLDYALMNVLVFLGAAFLENLNSRKLTRVTIAYGIFSGGLALIQWFFPLWFAYGLVSIWRYTTIVYVAWVVVFDLIWQVYGSATQLRAGASFCQGLIRHLFNTDYGSIHLMLTLVGTTVIIDLVNITFFNLNFPLKDFSLVGFTMSIAYILARRYSVSFEMNARELAALREREGNFELTAKETEVAQLLIEGATRREIARKLRLAAAEVDQRIGAIRSKLLSDEDPDPVATAAIAQYGLTRREAEVLRCLRQQMTNREIAAELVLSEETVKVHVHNLLKKLPAENRQQIAGWEEPDQIDSGAKG